MMMMMMMIARDGIKTELVGIATSMVSLVGSFRHGLCIIINMPDLLICIRPDMAL